MNYQRSLLLRLILIPCFLIIIVFGSRASVVRAIDPPAISVAPVWRPGTQLTSIFSSDIRYVDVEIYATSSVEYFAAEFNCTVAPTLLGSYTFDDPAGPGPHTPDPGDDVPMVRLGPDWQASQNLAATYVSPLSPAGALTIGISKVNPGGPMGHNGQNATQLIATIRYQVKSQLPAFTSGTSPFTCTSSFLDRNGVAVLTPTYSAPSLLNVLAGFAIKGNVSYQSRAAKSGIGVTCGTPLATSPGAISVVTDVSGNFSLSTRQQTNYNCQYYGNITDNSPGQQDDLYITEQTWFAMNGLSYSLLPVHLTGGNVDRTSHPPTEKTIDNDDVLGVTSNYNVTTPVGDANGDGKTDKSDLAIVANNFGSFDGMPSSHVLMGLARSYSTQGPDDRIWSCEGINCGPVTQLVAGTARNFWPMLSPDGTRIAFDQIVGDKHLLFVIPVAGGAAVQLTPTTPTGGMSWLTDSFAPSWSPDGSKIAFICSYNGSYPNGWNFNDGNLCTVDPNGKNLQMVTWGAKIYPPAWLDNHTLLYGSNANNSACPNTICEIDFSTMGQYPNPVAFDAAITGTADMPTVQLGLTTGRDLFYRSTQSGNSFIVIAEIPSSGPLAAFNTTPQFPGLLHAPVGWFDNGITFTRLSNHVDYYTSEHFGGRGLLYTDSTLPGPYSNTYFDSAGSTGAAPRWAEPGLNFVYDYAGNPYWDGVVTDSTNLWGERESMDWEP